MDDPILSCAECGRTFPLNEIVYRCSSCNYPLEVKYDYGELGAKLCRKSFENREATLWRYAELLPVGEETRVSLAEGWSPLHRSKRLGRELGLGNLYLKDDTRNPTGSFKDRGSAVGVSKALEIGRRSVGCISSGNMAASMAAYAARGGLQNLVFIPSGLPLEKIAQMLICGSRVISLKIPYQEICKKGVQFAAAHGIYMVHADAPMRVEGQKTVSFEICEQLGWRAPDSVIVPTSSGGNMSAHWKGWKELQFLGLVERLPAMIVVQAEGVSPIARAFKLRKEEVQPFVEGNTIATAIANVDPPSGLRVLRLLRESNGSAETVSDTEILLGQKLLAETEGIFAEPAGATSIAVLKKLVEAGVIDRSDVVVSQITGSGLKDSKSASKFRMKPLEFDSFDQVQVDFEE